MGWHATQIGARESYLIPRLLHKKSLLKSLSTDMWIPWANRVDLPGPLYRMKSRFNSELVGARVMSRNVYSIAQRIALRRFTRFDAWCYEGRSFGDWASRRISSVGIDDGDTVFAYTCAGLEVIRLAHSVGARAVYGQIDPGIAWYEMRQEESDMWPGAEPTVMLPNARYIDRLHAEWEEADSIIVNSEHSKAAIVSRGVRPEKVAILPLSVQMPESTRTLVPPKQGQKPRVLFVGSVCLAKGFQYFAEAEKLLRDRYEFVAAGAVHISPEFMAARGWKVTLLGHINRRQLTEQYLEAHVLVFPSLSDGFGQVQLEAMSFGLPVIATRNCGEVVRDSENGFVVSARSAPEIASSLEKLLANEDLLKQMSSRAYETAKQFCFERSEKIFWEINS